MAQMAAHLVEQVLPWVPTHQWVGSVPVLYGRKSLLTLLG
jgi:hypothetical protein